MIKKMVKYTKKNIIVISDLIKNKSRVKYRSIDGVGIRVALPNNYDSNKPSPLVILFHGHGADETIWAENPNGKGVADAFISGGYIAVSAAYTKNVSTWGSQYGIDAYVTAYEYVRDHYSIGSVVFYGNSMGGIESLLLLAEQRIPGVVAWIGSVPTTNLAANYENNMFSRAIKIAYRIASDGLDYSTKTIGHDPVLKNGEDFRGIPMYAVIATDDLAIIPSQNWEIFEAIVKPYAKEIITVNVTGGHSTPEISARARDMVAFADKYTK